jgi:hypothetical protein
VQALLAPGTMNVSEISRRVGLQWIAIARIKAGGGSDAGELGL